MAAARGATRMSRLRRNAFVATAFGVTSSALGVGASVGAVSLDNANPDLLGTFGPVRCLRAAMSLAAIIIDYKSTRGDNWEECHWRSAKRLLSVCEMNRGVYIKVGQHVAAMDYLLPRAYVETFQVLHSRAPQSKFEDVKKVISEELGVLVEDVDIIFADMNEQPLGSASLAQVHAATLRLPLDEVRRLQRRRGGVTEGSQGTQMEAVSPSSDTSQLGTSSSSASATPSLESPQSPDLPHSSGSSQSNYKKGRQVAVKVQHRTVRDRSEADVQVIQSLANVAKAAFPQLRLQWLCEIIMRHLPRELDFVHEGRNAEKVKAMLDKSCQSKVKVTVGSDNSSSPRNTSPNSSHSSASSRTAASTNEGMADRSVESVEVEFHTPEVIWELTTKRLIVMELCEGVELTNPEGVRRAGVNPQVVGSAVSELYSRMIFELGFLHADPHPGNLLAGLSPSTNESAAEGEGKAGDREAAKNNRDPKKVRLTLLDHGLYAHLSPKFIKTYSRMLKGIMIGDSKLMLSASVELGVESRDLGELLAAIIAARPMETVNAGGLKGALKGLTAEEESLMKSRTPLRLFEITDVLESIPMELVLVLKTNELVRALQRRFECEEFLCVAPLAKRCISTVKCEEEERLRTLSANERSSSPAPPLFSRSPGGSAFLLGPTRMVVWGMSLLFSKIKLNVMLMSVKLHYWMDIFKLKALEYMILKSHSRNIMGALSRKGVSYVM